MGINRSEASDHQQHIVLVHGLCHGAWCWYRLVDGLRSSCPGRPVTTVDLGGCGADPRQFDDVRTLSDYIQPLMELLESLPGNERVVLVGHSYGGLPLALAMERFPEKVAAAVFLSANMPSCSSPLGLSIHEFFRRNSASPFLDCKFDFNEGQQKPPTSAVFGPEYMANTLYAGCPPEDLELAKRLVRPGRLFVEEMMGCVVTEERYGSVKRVFVLCEEDEVACVDFQWSMIQNSPPDEVKIIEGAHHMAMLSKPEELQLCLDEIVAKYG